MRYNLKQIPSEYKNDNIVYHYTKMCTALKYILQNKSLRLSRRLKSNDPVENNLPTIRSILSANRQEDLNLHSKHQEHIDRIRSKVLEYVNCCNQASFCTNNKNYYPGKLEYYGFLKPRMWDQYADYYKGVCLAFSEEALSANKSIELKEITYKDFKNNSEISDFKIDLFQLNTLGYEKYFQKIIQEINISLFCKHTDYKDESEIRICSIDKKKQSYINISESLIGIIYSDDWITDFERISLLNFAKDQNLKLHALKWNFSSFTIRKIN